MRETGAAGACVMSGLMTCDAPESVSRGYDPARVTMAGRRETEKAEKKQADERFALTR